MMAKQPLSVMVDADLVARITALEAEVERLRGALTGILILTEDDLRCGRAGNFTSQIEADARAALEPSP